MMYTNRMTDARELDTFALDFGAVTTPFSLAIGNGRVKGGEPAVVGAFLESCFGGFKGVGGVEAGKVVEGGVGGGSGKSERGAGERENEWEDCELHVSVIDDFMIFWW